MKRAVDENMPAEVGDFRLMSRRVVNEFKTPREQPSSMIPAYVRDPMGNC